MISSYYFLRPSSEVVALPPSSAITSFATPKVVWEVCCQHRPSNAILLFTKGDVKWLDFRYIRCVNFNPAPPFQQQTSLGWVTFADWISVTVLFSEHSLLEPIKVTARSRLFFQIVTLIPSPFDYFSVLAIVKPGLNHIVLLSTSYYLYFTL